VCNWRKQPLAKATSWPSELHPCQRASYWFGEAASSSAPNSACGQVRFACRGSEPTSSPTAGAPLACEVLAPCAVGIARRPTSALHHFCAWDQRALPVRDSASNDARELPWRSSIGSLEAATRAPGDGNGERTSECRMSSTSVQEHAWMHPPPASWRPSCARARGGTPGKREFPAVCGGFDKLSVVGSAVDSRGTDDSPRQQAGDLPAWEQAVASTAPCLRVLHVPELPGLHHCQQAPHHGRRVGPASSPRRQADDVLSREHVVARPASSPCRMTMSCS
jgi:hypothetical protein